MEFGFNYSKGHRILLPADEQVRTGDGEVVRFPPITEQQRCRRPARTEQAEASGVDNNFELSYETELQLSLFDRLEWNRYRYNDTSYNTSPLFNSVGVART